MRSGTALALLVGVPIANVVTRYRYRGRALGQALVTVPFVLPTVVVALAFRMASPLRPDPDFRTDLLRLVDALRAHAQGRPD